MHTHFFIPGAHHLTVAEVCHGIGANGLVFVPNVGPSLFGPWPIVPTNIARRGETEPVQVRRTSAGLEVEVLDTRCPETIRLALAIAEEASRRAPEITDAQECGVPPRR